jgi:predicted nuclease of predicted toxin-antitoxin system
MRFLADENVMREIIDELRGLGLDVTSASELMQGAPDPDVLKSAATAGRILITEDQDFGDLVVRQGLPADGIALLELHKMSPQATVRRAVDAIMATGTKLIGAFTVIEPGRIRSRPI